MSENAWLTDEFVDRLVAGDRQAFGDMVERTSAKVYSLGLRMLGNEQDAEDMLQETYLKAYKALPGFEKRSAVTTWLFRIAANEALMTLRARRKENLQEIDAEPDEGEFDQPHEIVDWCCLPEEEMLTDETRAMLEQAAGKLSPALRVVFLLRDVEGFSGQQTAQILEISEDAVKTRLLRARLQLREELSAYFRERMGKG